MPVHNSNLCKCLFQISDQIICTLQTNTALEQKQIISTCYPLAIHPHHHLPPWQYTLTTTYPLGNTPSPPLTPLAIHPHHHLPLDNLQHHGFTPSPESNQTISDASFQPDFTRYDVVSVCHGGRMLYETLWTSEAHSKHSHLRTLESGCTSYGHFNPKTSPHQLTSTSLMPASNPPLSSNDIIPEKSFITRLATSCPE